MNFKEMFPLQVVINLDSRPDRLALCTKEFRKIGISPIRKPGIVGNFTNNSWWNGALGCMMSHNYTLQAARVFETNVFIFEDDVQFLGDNVLEIMDECCDELSSLEWDMIYFGANILKPFYKTSPRLAKLSHAQSTVAYGVNKKFLEKILEYINVAEITMPIDMIYAEKIIPNHNCFVSHPLLAIQSDGFSDIEQVQTNYSSYLEKRYWENIREKNDF